MSSRELCIMACVFCRDAQFQQWAGEQARSQRWVFFGCNMVGRSEALAKAFILAVCKVSSRNDLDVDADAAARFHELVRKPFLEWKDSRH